MPWSPSQHRLFEAAAHDPAIAKAHGIGQAKAATMASEGIKGQAKDMPKQPRMPQSPKLTPQRHAKNMRLVQALTNMARPA